MIGAFTLIPTDIYGTPAINNITELTDRPIRIHTGEMGPDVEGRLIEDIDFTKYNINGEPAGAFTYVWDRMNLNNTEPVPYAAFEQVITIHNNNSYSFEFTAGIDNFDDPTLADMRNHMFNSIKWLK
mgnify:CR=1 FL=1